MNEKMLENEVEEIVLSEKEEKIMKLLNEELAAGGGGKGICVCVN